MSNIYCAVFVSFHVHKSNCAALCLYRKTLGCTIKKSTVSPFTVLLSGHLTTHFVDPIIHRTTEVYVALSLSSSSSS